MEKYILKYIQETTQDEKVKRLLDYCKIQLDIKLWSSGRQIPYCYDWRRELYLSSQRKQLTWRGKIKNIFREIRRCFNPQEEKNPTWISIPDQSCKPHQILSLVNIPEIAKQKIEAEGVEIYCTNLDGTIPSGYLTPALLELHEWYHKYVVQSTFNEIINERNAIHLDRLYNQLVDELRELPIDAVIVRTSELFFEKLLIDAFRELRKPSITLLHGLPATYTKATEGRADYLTVWGEKIRENFIKVGYDPKRVFVAGNYKYDIVPNPKNLRNSLEDVLILTSDTYVEFQHEWNYEQFPIQDRSLLITYLYSVEKVLKESGVRQARLRPHPAINKDWLVDYVDMNFYRMDYDNLKDSLEKATLCIGQTSSTFLEALMNGVNYIVYEPGEENLTITNAPKVPPFDGSEKTLKTACTEKQLLEMIKSYYSPNFDMDAWMQGFDAKVIKKILEER